MKQKNLQQETWLDLSEAAAYLGVHFTTLRRWADAGQIPYLRTPGGRRRFAMKELEGFVQHLYQNAHASLALQQPLQDSAIMHARQSAQTLYSSSSQWMGRLNEEQRAWLKGTGRRLTALLLQYNSRTEEDEAFLEEGRRIAREYGRILLDAGFPLPETVRVFLVFRRSILDAIHETGGLSGQDDPESHKIYHRTTDFLDELLLNLVGSYSPPNVHALD